MLKLIKKINMMLDTFADMIIEIITEVLAPQRELVPVYVYVDDDDEDEVCQDTAPIDYNKYTIFGEVIDADGNYYMD